MHGALPALATRAARVLPIVKSRLREHNVIARPGWFWPEIVFEGVAILLLWFGVISFSGLLQSCFLGKVPRRLWTLNMKVAPTKNRCGHLPRTDGPLLLRFFGFRGPVSNLWLAFSVCGFAAPDFPSCTLD